MSPIYLLFRFQVKKGKEHINFFTIPEYEQWLEQVPDPKKWDAKYYKVIPSAPDS